MRHLYIVHHPSGCPPGLLYMVPQPTVHTQCGVLYNRGEVVGFPPVRVNLCDFSLRGKVMGFSRGRLVSHSLRETVAGCAYFRVKPLELL